MLKDYLESRDISVYELSKKSYVPYTTLNEFVNEKKNISDCKIKTIESIATALNLSIEDFLIVATNKKISLSNSWEENKNKKFLFPEIVKNKNYDYRRIHPLKQKMVNELYKLLKKEKAISKAYIFGSSVNIRCRANSDIDIALELKDEFFNSENKNRISELVQEKTEYSADIVWLNSIDQTSQLYENIKKGVIIYEQVIG